MKRDSHSSTVLNILIICILFSKYGKSWNTEGYFLRIHVSLRNKRDCIQELLLKMERTWCTFIINLLSTGNLKRIRHMF